MTAHRTSVLILGLVGLALAAGVTGCGSSSSSSSSATSNASGGTPTGGSGGTPIKLVALIDETGPNSGGQGYTAAVIKAWLKANAATGVAGHPVQVQIDDTQGNPTLAAKFVQQTIADKSVVGVISVDAITEDNSLKALSSAGLPVIGGVAYDPTVWGPAVGNKYIPGKPLPNVYEVYSAPPASSVGLVQEAQANHLTHLATVDFSTVPASKAYANIVAAIAKSAGLQVSEVSVDPTAPNFTAACIELKQKQIDDVAFFIPPTIAGRVASDCNAQGYTGAYTAGEGTITSDLYGHIGPNRLIGTLSAFPWYASTPAIEQFRAAMKAASVPASEWQGGSSPAAWTTMALFAKAMNDHKAKLGATITRQDVVGAYGAVKNETLGGLLPGPATYSPGNVKPPACYWQFSYRNGTFSGGANYTCAAKSFGAG